MPPSRRDFRRLLREDESECFPWERIPDDERRKRGLAAPATYLGSGSERFYRLLSHLERPVSEGVRICDFGAYPGTAYRLLSRLWPGHRADLTAAGFSFSDEFSAAMDQLGVRLLEMEFDARVPPPHASEHILSFPQERAGGAYDVAICTEVIEHQLQPLFLLAGINRFVSEGGTLLLTTNSATFVGDVLKLAVGRHNVETLGRSHVLADGLWRPHIRLYTLAELDQLLRMCGFEPIRGEYFDNGNVYRGAKGVALSALRRAAGVVPHLRSHIWFTARRVGPISDETARILSRTLSIYGLRGAIPIHPD